MSEAAVSSQGGATAHGAHAGHGAALVRNEHGHTGQGDLAHHFETMGQQNEAARLGMWLFLATEVLLFAGLFAAYAFYRFNFGEAFAQASRHLDLTLGTINTVVLITSSFTAALSIHFARENKRVIAVLCIVATIAMAFAFLGIKAIEYHQKFEEGALPGRFFHFEEVPQAGASMYFTLYFLMTGLHAVHIIAGMTVLGVLGVKTWHGAYTSRYYMGLELGVLYWHLVDLVWIFLFPLLYLI